MKVVVLSDTHSPRFWKGCPPAVAAQLETADVILHAGDVCTPDVLDLLAGYAPLHVVLGNNDVPEVGLWGAFGIGCAQALALMPGVSRSGITISAARFLGLTRDAAARLSFLLLVPIVLGAVVLKGVTDVLLGDLPAGWAGPFLVGTLAAAGSGLLAIQWLLGYVRRHDYTVFVVYRLVAAAIIVLLIASGVLDATF